MKVTGFYTEDEPKFFVLFKSARIVAHGFQFSKRILLFVFCWLMLGFQETRGQNILSQGKMSKDKSRKQMLWNKNKNTVREMFFN